MQNHFCRGRRAPVGFPDTRHDLQHGGRTPIARTRASGPSGYVVETYGALPSPLLLRCLGDKGAPLIAGSFVVDSKPLSHPAPNTPENVMATASETVASVRSRVGLRRHSDPSSNGTTPVLPHGTGSTPDQHIMLLDVRQLVNIRARIFALRLV